MTKIWQRGTGHASFNLQVNDGQADLQLSFKLGKPDDPHLPLPSKKTRGKGEKQRERDRARAAAHHAKLAAASAVLASEQPVETLEASTEATLGSPVLTAPLPPSRFRWMSETQYKVNQCTGQDEDGSFCTKCS